MNSVRKKVLMLHLCAWARHYDLADKVIDSIPDAEVPAVLAQFQADVADMQRGDVDEALRSIEIAELRELARQ